MRWLQNLWYRDNKKLPIYIWPLLILSGLYRLITHIRQWLYQKRIKTVTSFEVPVIVVGNLTVGGTGKTPLVAWLVRFLKEKGYRPGIVSRGYGATASNWPQVVTTQSSVNEVGDEPLMLKQQTDCPIVVDPQRVRAVKKLLSEFTCDIVISDDGLQHYALDRSIEIAVVDGKRRLGNGFCLPLGPLREPAKRLAKVDFIVCNGNNPSADEFEMQLIVKECLSVQDRNKKIAIETLNSGHWVAVAAIGHPEQFFQTLQKLGLSFEKRIFRDHHSFRAQDFDFLNPEHRVIMTEKDAVKCRSFADHRFYYITVEALLSDAFQRQFMRKLSMSYS